MLCAYSLKSVHIKITKLQKNSSGYGRTGSHCFLSPVIQELALCISLNFKTYSSPFSE